MLRCGILFLFCILAVNISHIFAESEYPLDLEPIIVTKDTIDLLDSQILVAENIKESSFSSPIEALSLLPLDLQSRSPKLDIQTDFSLRGSGFQGVLILLGGQRINDSQTAHHNSDQPFTKEDINRIEVLPGACSSLFGPDAIGGAINFSLQKPKEKKSVLELGGGTGRTKSALFSIAEKKEDLGVRLSLERQESDGFSFDTDFKKLTGRLDYFLEVPGREFNLGFGYQEKEFGAYDFYTPGAGYPSKEWTKTYLINSGVKLDRAGLVIKPNFLWRRHYDKFMLDKTLLRSDYLAHHCTDLYTPNIIFEKESALLGRLGLGLEFGQERIDSTTLGQHQRDHGSIFLEENKELFSGFSLGLSGRMDNFDDFDQVCTGSLNFKSRLKEEYTLRFGISRSTRIPSFTELYYNDPTTSGNPQLSAEESLSLETGCDYNKDRFSLGLTLFLRDEDDFIDWIKRDLFQLKWEAENISDGKVRGIETHWKSSLGENTELNLFYTFINKKRKDRGYLYKYGLNYAQHLASASYSLKLPIGVQSLTAIYKKKPGRKGWILLNTHFSHRLNKNSELLFNFTNLLDTEYQEIPGVPQPGRWLEFGLRLTW